jgi:hypothetical protein
LVLLGVLCAAAALIVQAAELLQRRKQPPAEDTGKRPQEQAVAGADPTPAPPMPAAPQTELDRVRAERERSADAARKKLLAQFDATITRLTKAEVPAVPPAVVMAEKQRFEQRGLLPWSEPMRTYMTGYLHAVRSARDSLVDAYVAEIDEQDRQQNMVKGNALRAELAALQADQVVARWSHQVRDGDPGVIDLYANGRIVHPQSENTWTFEGGILVLRWPNDNALGGAWVDTCPVSPDGKMYSGQNQIGFAISGSYYED